MYMIMQYISIAVYKYLNTTLTSKVNLQQLYYGSLVSFDSFIHIPVSKHVHEYKHIHIIVHLYMPIYDCVCMQILHCVQRKQNTRNASRLLQTAKNSYKSTCLQIYINLSTYVCLYVQMYECVCIHVNALGNQKRQTSRHIISYKHRRMCIRVETHTSLIAGQEYEYMRLQSIFATHHPPANTCNTRRVVVQALLGLPQ